MTKKLRTTLVSLGCVVVVGGFLTRGPARKSWAQDKATTIQALDEVKAPLPLEASPTEDRKEASNAPVAAAAELALPAAAEPEPVAAVPSNANGENDPEKLAKEFVEKNQIIAGNELAKLKKEAEALRSRLQKVESAIRRWESVAHALKQSEGIASKADGSWKPELSTRRARMELDGEAPTVLESIDRTESPTVLEPISPPGIPERRISGDSQPGATLIPSPEMLSIPAKPASTPALKAVETAKPKS